MGILCADILSQSQATTPSGSFISLIVIWFMRIIRGLSVNLGVSRDSAVSMGGEKMRGRESMGKRRVFSADYIIFLKALSFGVPILEFVNKAPLMIFKSFRRKKIII